MSTPGAAPHSRHIGLAQSQARRKTIAMLELNEDQIARFREDGFVIVERIIDAEAAALAASRFEGLWSTTGA